MDHLSVFAINAVESASLTFTTDSCAMLCTDQAVQSGSVSSRLKIVLVRLVTSASERLPIIRLVSVVKPVNDISTRH